MPALTPTQEEKMAAKPWHYTATALPHGGRSLKVHSATGGVICILKAGAGDKESVAALIAAAPELYEALERIAECERFTRAGGATADDIQSYEDGLQEAVSIAVAALARAEGRS